MGNVFTGNVFIKDTMMCREAVGLILPGHDICDSTVCQDLGSRPVAYRDFLKGRREKKDTLACVLAP